MVNDDSTTLSDLKTLVSDFRDTRDWKQFHNPKDLATAISIEAAELLESFLWKSTDEIEAMISDLPPRTSDRLPQSQEAKDKGLSGQRDYG